MKKNGFLEGAMISTICVVICKVLGLIYVIPFYSIIGAQGGALYSYAYSIYGIFLSLATSGIPIAMSKIISEYHSLGYENLKQRAYNLGKYLITGIGILSFLILFIFAKNIAYLIIGDIKGGNTIEGVTFVIRIVSTALLFVPIYSVKKGFLQGQKYMTVPNIASVLEQLVRVIVIIGGSFLALKVFKLSLDTTVGLAVFGATVGAIFAYMYITLKIKKNNLLTNTKATREESRTTNKDIIKKIVFYALPFIVIDLIRSLYNMIDVFTVVKTLSKLGYSMADAENIIGSITTWASKLSSIVMSIVVGLTVSLVPNIMSSYVKKNYKDVDNKINLSLQLLLVTTIPMTVGLSFLSSPVWTMFYGNDILGINIFRIYIFTALTFTFYSILLDTTQTLNNTKIAIGTLILIFILKGVLNVPIMYLCDFVNIKAYYGPIITTILTQLLAIIILLYYLKKKFNTSYTKSFVVLVKTMLCTSIMVVSLSIIKLFIPITNLGRMTSLFVCILYAIIGFVIYFITGNKLHIFDSILNNEKMDNLLKKLHLKK